MNTALKNSRREQFAQLVASGSTSASAYREVFKKTQNADVHGPKLTAIPEVSRRIAELRAKVDAEGEQNALMTLTQKRRFLATVIQKDEVAMRDRLRALEIDSKLAGEFTEKLDISSNLPQVVIGPGDMAALQARRRVALQGGRVSNEG